MNHKTPRVSDATKTWLFYVSLTLVYGYWSYLIMTSQVA